MRLRKADLRHIVLLSLVLAACSGGGGSGTPLPSAQPPPLPPPKNRSIGGIWEGVNLRGRDVIGIVTEDGDFHFAHSSGHQIGHASVTVDQVHSDYTYVMGNLAALVSFPNKRECTLTGVVDERQTLVLDSDCHPVPDDWHDPNAETSLILTYNPMYEQGASLEAVAGLYEIPGAQIRPEPPPVLRIDSNGHWFRQRVIPSLDRGPFTCTQNGHVDVLHPAYNIYSVTYVNSCDSPRVPDYKWDGVAALDTSTEPNTLVYMVSADDPEDPQVGSTQLVYGRRL